MHWCWVTGSGWTSLFEFPRFSLSSHSLLCVATNWAKQRSAWDFFRYQLKSYLSRLSAIWTQKLMLSSSWISTGCSCSRSSLWICWTVCLTWSPSRSRKSSMSETKRSSPTPTRGLESSSGQVLPLQQQTRLRKHHPSANLWVRESSSTSKTNSNNRLTARGQ